jgi:hypothetical protein
MPNTQTRSAAVTRWLVALLIIASALQVEASDCRPTSQVLQQMGTPKIVSGIDYPEWFASKKIPASERQHLVELYNYREWLLFRDMLDQAAEPQITTKDGRTLRLQPLLDALTAVGGATNPESSQVNSGNSRSGVVIKPRDGYQQDTPSGEETPTNVDVETIDKYLRWVRQKQYAIPPTIGSTGNCIPQSPSSARANSGPIGDTNKAALAQPLTARLRLSRHAMVRWERVYRTA